MRCASVFLLACLCGEFAAADQAKPIFGTNEYVEYLPGSLPVVIGAPHGGSLKPEDMPDRTEGKVMQDALSAVTPQYWMFWMGLFLVVLVLVGREKLLRPWTWFGGARK